MRIFTVGHSTRTLDEFLDLLRSFTITLLIDIRSAPGSRRYPHFGREPLSQALTQAGIGYRHEPDLGGRRRMRPDSPHVGWRNEGFRGYADHMDSEAFRLALDRVIAAAATETVALMCAEAVPWRCHRHLVADALLARGIDVEHILGPERAQRHTLTPFARLDGVRVVYDAVAPLFGDYFGRTVGRGIPRKPRPR